MTGFGTRLSHYGMLTRRVNPPWSCNDEEVPVFVCFVLFVVSPNCFFKDVPGYSDIGCYGATRVKTLHIDRLAATVAPTLPAGIPSSGSIVG